MRPFTKSAARGPISVLCIALLIGPVFGGLLVSAPAAAQYGTLEVAVVDFRNTSKVPQEIYGTMATDAVVVELLRSGKFSVTKADDLQAKKEELGYGSNVLLTPSMMVRLGQEVGASSIVYGEVMSVDVDAEKKRAEVRVAVNMLDVTSGELINGAIATGTSNPRVGYTADKETDWIIEAINNAARKSVEEMVRYIIPEATIIGTYGTDEVLLSKGAREGIYRGMEMIVLRRGEGGVDEVVGRIRVTKVSDTDARAKITQSTRGAQPEDRVRAVYEPPADTGGDTQGPRSDDRERVSKGNKLLWTLAALVGLWILLKPDGEKESLSGAVAAAFAGPAEFGSRYVDGGILIAWNTPNHVRYQDIMEYHVWRDSPRYPEGGGSANVGPCGNPDMVSAISINSALGNYDHHTVDDIAAREFDYSYPGDDHTDLESGSVTGMTGIDPGRSHNYWVSCVYRRIPARSEDEGGSITYWETTPVYAGRATYFAQRPAQEWPGSNTATEYVDLSDVTFRWRGCLGADTYAIEVSPDPTFPRESTWVSSLYQPTNQDGMVCNKTFKNVLNNSSELGNLPGETVLYWRVGARNSQDKPGPYPAGPVPQKDGAKNTRYIYSDPNNLSMFLTIGGVPQPPGGGDDGGGGDIPLPPPPPPN